MEEFKYVIFQLGDQRYGMNLLYVNGMVQDYHITPIPNAPEGVKGIINLRGDVVPVYSLRERFGMDSRIDNSEKSLLITQSDDMVLAYEVDCVVGIEEMEPNRINRMPSIASNEETTFMEEVLHIGENIVIAISADEVLSGEMKMRINQMMEENQ
ncbi:MAG: chemotaxis protein CheW [Lachnospiraceae bacterium]|nr:chemotaxis protein CheW [Lachnospiraceae bacterium]MDE6624818.1 chemotaxis protein CheW [Lachnospiraceae bacterium]